MFCFVFSFLLICYASSPSVSWMIKVSDNSKMSIIQNKKEFIMLIRNLKSYKEGNSFVMKRSNFKSVNGKQSIIIIKDISYQNIIKVFENILFDEEIIKHGIVKIALKKSNEFVRVTWWNFELTETSNLIFKRQFESLFPDSRNKFLYISSHYKLFLFPINEKEITKINGIDLNSFVSAEKDNIIRVYSQKNTSFRGQVVIMYLLNGEIENVLIYEKENYNHILKTGLYARFGIYKSKIPFIKSFIFYQLKATLEEEMSKEKKKITNFNDELVKVIYLTHPGEIISMESFLETLISIIINDAH